MKSNSCYSCYSCDFCYSCDYCYSCYYCYSCNSCNSCNSCDFCYSCDSCDSCNFCEGCYNCKNLVNGFRCVNVKLSKKDENRYWIFNKEVTEEEWDKRYDLGYEEKIEICDKCGQEIKQYPKGHEQEKK